MNQLKIDIVKSEYEGLKSLKIIGYIFSTFLFVVGILNLIMVSQKDAYGTKIISLAMPFLIAFAILLQLQGKWIFSKYILITDEVIEWKRFNKTILYWSQIQSVNFGVTSFRFVLKDNSTKVFTLENLSLEDIQELKEKITIKCERDRIEILGKQ